VEVVLVTMLQVQVVVLV
jgi:hypothetical protein